MSNFVLNNGYCALQLPERPMKQIKTMLVCLALVGSISGCDASGSGANGSHDVGEY